MYTDVSQWIGIYAYYAMFEMEKYKLKDLRPEKQKKNERPLRLLNS